MLIKCTALTFGLLRRHQATSPLLQAKAVDRHFAAAHLGGRRARCGPAKGSSSCSASVSLGEGRPRLAECRLCGESAVPGSSLQVMEARERRLLVERRVRGRLLPGSMKVCLRRQAGMLSVQVHLRITCNMAGTAGVSAGKRTLGWQR